MRKVSASQTGRELLATETQAVDPVSRHRVEIGRIRMSLLAAYEVAGWVQQGSVELAEIGKNEVPDPGLVRFLVNTATVMLLSASAVAAAVTARKPLIRAPIAIATIFSCGIPDR